MSLISSFPTVKESADEHEIGDEYLTDGYLTEKEQQQLLLDEESLRETLEEEARAEKSWGGGRRIKQEQAHDVLFMLEFEVADGPYSAQLKAMHYKGSTYRSIESIVGRSYCATIGRRSVEEEKGRACDGCQEYYPTKDYSMGQGSAHGSDPVDDDSPVEEMSPVKAKKPSKCASKAKKNDIKEKEPPKE
ncbi:hypothetical protein Tco_0242377 [Tanacetum coccineum]